MTKAFFEMQVARLAKRFGDRAFDQEFQALVAQDVADMPAEEFKRTVDVWIGSRRPHDPPMRAEFIEARQRWRGRELAGEVKGVVKVLERPIGTGLQAYLESHGAKSVMEIFRRKKRELGGEK